MRSLNEYATNQPQGRSFDRSAGEAIGARTHAMLAGPDPVAMRPGLPSGDRPATPACAPADMTEVSAAGNKRKRPQCDLDAIFAALADATRRDILAMLLEDDMAVTDVAGPLPMSLAAVSKHLGVLTRAGLIVQEKRGRVKWCKLDPDALRAASVWMQGFGQFDPVNLEFFERFLAAELSKSESASGADA